MTTVFITGTDTGSGKTHVARRLLEQATAAGAACVGFKPVAAGGVETPDGLRNEDALALQAAGTVPASYAEVNPFLLREPIAPHVAAAEEGVSITSEGILRAHAALASRAELVVVEGAGGWRVPLGPDLFYSDLVAEAGWPVLLVVGMRLGCLNHALLSAESITARARLLGWVANCIPPLQNRLQANVQALRERMPAPLLGVVAADDKVLPREPRLQLGILLSALQTTEFRP